MSKIAFAEETVIPAFSCPIYYANVKDFEVDLSELEGADDEEFYVNEFHTNTLNSVRPNILLEERFAPLREVSDQAMKNYVYGVLRLPESCRIRLVDSWMVVGAPGSITNQHVHINSMFSGVFYLQSVPNAGDFTLYMTEGQNTYSTPTVRPDPVEYNVFNSPFWTASPQTNDVIIFPSHIFHRVSKNESEHVRMAVAFNYFLDGVISENSTGRLSLTVNEK